MIDDEFKEKIYNLKFTILRKELMFLYVIWMINIIIQSKLKEDKLRIELQITHIVLQIIMLIGLIFS